MSPPAVGQAIAGGEGSPNVIIDYSVLDELGPAPTVPRMDRPAVVLKPPAEVSQRPARGPETSAPVRTPPRKPASIAGAAPGEPAEPAELAETPRPAPRRKPADTGAERGAVESLVPPPPKIEPVPAGNAEKAAPPPRSAEAPPAPKARTAMQTAALPEAGTAPTVRRGALRRIGFVPGSATLNGVAADELRAVAEAMARDEALRIQLMAYAGKAADSASQARRLSLARALAARSQLIEHGVKSTRIDVRALGNESAGGPADRVDIIVTRR